MAAATDLTGLRAATEADVPALAAIARAAYERYVERIGRPPRPMTQDYRDVVRDLGVTVAEREGEIAGFVALTTDEEGFQVDNVAVAPPHQGTGLGRTLLEHAETEARRAGFGAIYLYTHELMTENQALYARAGYEEYDRRRDGDAVLVYMRKTLA